MVNRYYEHHARGAILLYPLLVQKARNKERCWYIELASEANYIYKISEFHYRNISNYLNHLMRWCETNGKAPLTALVGSGPSCVPGTGLETIRNPEDARQAVYKENWPDQAPPVSDLEIAFSKYRATP